MLLKGWVDGWMDEFDAVSCQHVCMSGAKLGNYKLGQVTVTQGGWPRLLRVQR